MGNDGGRCTNLFTPALNQPKRWNVKVKLLQVAAVYAVCSACGPLHYGNPLVAIVCGVFTASFGGGG